MSKEYTLNLTLEELEIIGHGLGFVQYNRAKAVIEKVEKQVNAQMETIEVVLPEEEVE